MGRLPLPLSLSLPWSHVARRCAVQAVGRFIRYLSSSFLSQLRKRVGISRSRKWRSTMTCDEEVGRQQRPSDCPSLEANTMTRIQVPTCWQATRCHPGNFTTATQAIHAASPKLGCPAWQASSSKVAKVVKLTVDLCVRWFPRARSYLPAPCRRQHRHDATVIRATWRAVGFPLLLLKQYNNFRLIVYAFLVQFEYFLLIHFNMESWTCRPARRHPPQSEQLPRARCTDNIIICVDVFYTLFVFLCYLCFQTHRQYHYMCLCVLMYLCFVWFRMHRQYPI